MVPERTNAYKVFGSAYKGLYHKIGANFSRVREILQDLTISAEDLDGSPRVYHRTLFSLIEQLGKTCPNPTLEKRAKEALEQIPASPITFSFIANYFRTASREGSSEEEAIKKVLENFPSILLCTAYIPYPSSQGRLLIQGMRAVSPEDSGSFISKIFPQAKKDDIERAVKANFNPLKILASREQKNPFSSEDRNLHHYIWLSKQALLSFAYTLTKRFSSEPDPLWVFLMRDAHLLYLIAQAQLPGEKIEIEVAKITLASQEELAAIFEARGYNIGEAKEILPISNYDRLIKELGFKEEPTSRREASSTRPAQVVAELAQKQSAENLAYDLELYQSAQEILSSLSVPEQVFQLLLTSGIAEAAENNRPVVFLDTGYKGSLPLLLQAALSRMLTQRGHKPNIHAWLDYAKEPFHKFVNYHRCGPWNVSPLDGLVSMRRAIIPGREKYELKLFTTPFDAVRQARIIRPYDQFEASLIDS